MLKLQHNVSLAPLTWFRVGGIAKNFVRVSSIEQIVEVLQKFPNFFVIGNTSNLLISDREIETCIIKLGSAFSKIEQISETKFKVGASCLDSTLAHTIQESGISGMEFLATIPGTVGGNIVMNAGCFGGEIFEILESVDVILPSGKLTTLQKNEIPHSYRHAHLPEKSIIISATLNGVVSTKEKVRETINGFIQKRLDAQPSNVRTGGSTFTNPTSEKAMGRSAWQLIQEAQAHKFEVGSAKVSEKHSNFLINAGGATAKDIFTLGEMIRSTVLKKTGIELEWEVKFLGEF
jgi:UDP-N-acetylmuramate dehydrogenase